MNDDRRKLLMEQIEEWEALTRRASPGPWRAEAPFSGDDWLVASLGASAIDGEDWHVCTSGVRASEMTGDSKTDAAFIAEVRRAMPILLRIARAHLEAGDGT